MTTETPIRGEFLDQDELTLRLALGACRLEVTPAGPDAPWVEGSYTDPTDDLPIATSIDGGTATVSQQRSVSGTFGLVRGLPVCVLRVGSARPYRLAVDTGASDVELDLTGLPLTGLDVRSGAGKVALRCDAPNPVALEHVGIKVGAGAVRTSGLGNLGAATMRVDGGASGVELDLSGDVRRDLRVDVTAGVSSVTVTLPAAVPGTVHTDATLSGTDLGDGFVTREGAYHTVVEPVAGQPRIEVHASVTLGGIALRTV
jgi:hypothetical protein